VATTLAKCHPRTYTHSGYGRHSVLSTMMRYLLGKHTYVHVIMIGVVHIMNTT